MSKCTIVGKLVLAALIVTSTGCALPKPSPPTSVSLFPAEDDLTMKGKYADAEAAFGRLVEAEKRARAPSIERRIDALRGLGMSIDLQGRPHEGEPILLEALQLAEAHLNSESLTRARVYEALGSLSVDLGRAVEAERYYRQAYAILAKILGERHPETLMIMGSIGGPMVDQSRYAEAEALYRKVIAQFESIDTEKPVDPAATENNFAFLLNTLGRFAEAEPYYRRALERWRSAYGENHPLVGSGYSNVASNLDDQGRRSEAIPLRQRALEVALATVGEGHPQVAARLNNLGANLVDEGKVDEALPLYRKADAIWRKAFGPDNYRLVASSTNIATALLRKEQYAEAERLLKDALRIALLAHGGMHPATANAYQMLGWLYFVQDRNADALPFYIKARDISKATLGTSHLAYASHEDTLAGVYNQLEDFGKSEEASRLALYAARRARTLLAGSSSIDLAKNQGGDLASLTWHFRRYLTFGRIGADVSPEQEVQIEEEGFLAVQDLLGWSAGQDIIQAAARRSAGDSGLAALLRRQQDAVAKARDAEAAMIAALSDGNVETAKTQQTIYFDSSRQLAALEDRLDREFPTYRSFLSPKGLSTEDSRSHLTDGEGLIVAALSGEEVHVFLVTEAGAWWVEKDVGKDMLGWIAQLRCDVDEASCPHALKVERRRDIFATASDGPRFDFTSAHRIYQTIFEPFEPQLRKVRRLYVVTSPALRDFSMAMLVPRKEDVRRGRLATTRWLGDRFALTYLPSVASLALDRSQRPFMHDSLVGYGDPALAGSDDPSAIDSFGDVSRGSFIASRDELNRLSPLPGTRIELEAMRTLFGASANIRLGPQATETQVREDPLLRSASVLAFATHALLPDPKAGIEEPGLVMSPASHSTPSDDGYLAASEVAALSLEAQWVILSACNTASTGGSESNGLSALARAFLYAGAEALLASHWRVSDEATAVLTVETLKAWRSGDGLTRAESLQAAMRAVRTGKSADGSKIDGWQPEWAHPAAWAPFTITANRDR